MNERIRELMEEVVWVEIDPDSKMETIYTCGPEDFEAFAELIVRECAEVCMKEIDTGWVMAPKSPWMAKQILEHFGVEE